jgi:hypothetical protein
MFYRDMQKPFLKKICWHSLSFKKLTQQNITMWLYKEGHHNILSPKLSKKNQNKKLILKNEKLKLWNFNKQSLWNGRW